MPHFGMTRRHVVAGAAGAVLALGGLYAGGAFANADAPAADDDGTSSTTTIVATVPFVAEGESLVGNTFLVPVDVRVVNDAIAFEYDLIGLGGELLTAVPERFVLTALDGTEHTASVSTEAARQVRFEGAAGGGVAEIAVTRWRLRMYEEYDAAISLSEGLTLSDGTRLEVDRVLDETVGVLLYFTVTSGDNHGFGGAGFTDPIVISSGLGWQDVLVAGGGSSSFNTPSLAVTVDPVPDPVPVHVVALPWVPMEERVVVYTNGGGA